MRPADIWLTDEEQTQYLHGLRAFRLQHKIEVEVV
jgi:hypothetical protein